jgi:hypothetical protein
MKEKPILFSSPMVRAILEGRKSQTRRIIKPQPLGERFSAFVGGYDDIPKMARFWIPDKSGNNNPLIQDIKCPYGQPGDILWVRETWVNNNGELPIDLGFVYKADLGSAELEYSKELKVKWKTSIFMPREACRIRLEVTDVRVERLNDITDADAKAEGIDYVIDKITGYCGRDYLSGGYNLMTTPYHGYRSLWKSINGNGSWEKNPWVWVIEFKRY